jgi:hypothetical protein
MNLEREFDSRIAAIHGLDSTARAGSNIEESAMDIRHEEFQAMASVFLGDGFDPTKLGQVEVLQIALHKQQAELYHRYEAEELGPEEYVESFNTSLDETFAKCEAILGPESFLKLFGAPRSELAGFIDREAFVQAHQRRDSLKSIPQPSQTEESSTPAGYQKRMKPEAAADFRGFQESVVPAGYRKRRGQDTWHFCSNCSSWPTSGYDARSDSPRIGELCNECESRRAHGNCG